jgi:hypothetical protein
MISPNAGSIKIQSVAFFFLFHITYGESLMLLASDRCGSKSEVQNLISIALLNLLSLNSKNKKAYKMFFPKQKAPLFLGALFVVISS